MKTLQEQRTESVLKIQERIEELEKENAKAKELLKRYVPYRQITDSKVYKDLANETEQFLNEVVK